MSDFGETWRLIRQRFDDAVAGLTSEQLNWRLHGDTLTIGEMAVHVAGVEVSFLSQLTDETLSADLLRLKSAATDGVVNDKPFPYSSEEIDSGLVEWASQQGRDRVAAVIDNLSPEVRAKTIQSALGPIVDGTGAFARLAYHPGYHQGQVHMIKSAPGYPR